MKKTFLILLLFSSSLQARDLGTFGETFPIMEESLLTVIETKLKKLAGSGELEMHQKKIQEQVLLKLQRPIDAKNIVKTSTPRIFTYNPSITIPFDLKDENGKVFHKKGTTINPLDTHSLKYALLFIDGDDKAQVHWAINQKIKSKIILVKGAPFELMKQHSTPLFFDQGGALTVKFGITQVPARITQEDKHLKIEEILPSEGGPS